MRPLGILALAAIGIELLIRRDWRNFSAALGIGAVIGGLYALPLVIYFEDPLANVHFYLEQDWDSASPLTLPFVPIVRGALRTTEPATNVAKVTAWLLVVTAGSVAMVFTHRFRAHAKRHRAETSFFVLYVAVVISYNSQIWAWAEFPRFAVPALPLVYFALEPWLPKRRDIVYVIGSFSVVLSALSTMSVRHAAEAIRDLLSGTGQ